MKVTFTSHEKQTSKQLAVVLRREYGFSAAMVRRLKNASALEVDGVNVFTNHVLSAGQHVVLHLDKAEAPCDVPPEAGAVEILYEDDGLLAVNKPAGCLTHPSHARLHGTVAGFVCHYLQSKGELPSCHPVNRLDRDTSGVVLYAKNSYLSELASAALSSDAARKEYLALVWGKPSENKGVIRLPIARKSETDLMRIVSPWGQQAVTHYEVISVGDLEGQTVSLLRLTLETGRTHQIRVHCSHCGFPLLGDKLYGTADSQALSNQLGIFTQALHAEKLLFVHPMTKGFLEITAPVQRKELLSVAEKLHKVF